MALLSSWPTPWECKGFRIAFDTSWAGRECPYKGIIMAQVADTDRLVTGLVALMMFVCVA